MCNVTFKEIINFGGEAIQMERQPLHYLCTPCEECIQVFYENDSSLKS